MAVMKKRISRLLVVESPTKAKTISRFLGKDYKVVATVGHLRDLPKNKMGVDLDGDIKIDYVVDGAKNKAIAELKGAASGVDEIWLATDPDREGEAIAWHVKWILENLGGKKTNKGKFRRIVFHEITKGAIEEAMKKPGKIDDDLVAAQQGRRVLDRAVGYSLSPVLWKKVRRGLSAGRVQSVAVRLVCEREREIDKFSKERFFKVFAKVKKGKDSFVTELVRVGKERFMKTVRLNLFDGSYSYSKSIFDKKIKLDSFLKKLSTDFVVNEVK
ncbi:DNA topoisomerase I, partial [Patescibacteria group bacterium]|nr:DNA topoisomerase I [Patescibacteria group bacterium]